MIRVPENALVRLAGMGGDDCRMFTALFGNVVIVLVARISVGVVDVVLDAGRAYVEVGHPASVQVGQYLSHGCEWI